MSFRHQVSAGNRKEIMCWLSHVSGVRASLVLRDLYSRAIKSLPILDTNHHSLGSAIRYWHQVSSTPFRYWWWWYPCAFLGTLWSHKYSAYFSVGTLWRPPLSTVTSNYAATRLFRFHSNSWSTYSIYAATRLFFFHYNSWLLLIVLALLFGDGRNITVD